MSVSFHILQPFWPIFNEWFRGNETELKKSKAWTELPVTRPTRWPEYCLRKVHRGRDYAPPSLTLDSSRHTVWVKTKINYGSSYWFNMSFPGVLTNRFHRKNINHNRSESRVFAISPPNLVGGENDCFHVSPWVWSVQIRGNKKEIIPIWPKIKHKQLLRTWCWLKNNSISWAPRKNKLFKYIRLVSSRAV